MFVYLSCFLKTENEMLVEKTVDLRKELDAARERISVENKKLALTVFNPSFKNNIANL